MRNFQYPLKLDDVRNFCHPNPKHPFGKPWLHEGKIWVANGYVCLQIDTWLDVTEPNADAAKRANDLPWHTVTEWNEDEKNTGILDERRGGLLRFGEQPMWKKNGAGLLQASVSHLVAVGHYAIALPVPALQLIAKLPRAKVRISGGGCNFLPFRFNGGCGLAVGMMPTETPRYHIFKAPEKFKL